MALPVRPKNYTVTDEVVMQGKNPIGLRGLCLRVTPGGAKTFNLQGTTVTGKPIWLKVGRMGDITRKSMNGNLSHAGDATAQWLPVINISRRACSPCFLARPAGA